MSNYSQKRDRAAAQGAIAGGSVASIAGMVHNELGERGGHKARQAFYNADRNESNIDQHRSTLNRATGKSEHLISRGMKLKKVGNRAMVAGAVLGAASLAGGYNKKKVSKMSESVWGIDHGAVEKKDYKDRNPLVRPDVFNSRKQNVGMASTAGAIGGAGAGAMIGGGGSLRARAVNVGVGTAIGAGYGAGIGALADHSGKRGSSTRQNLNQEHLDRKKKFRADVKGARKEYKQSFKKSAWGIDHGDGEIEKAFSLSPLKTLGVKGVGAAKGGAKDFKAGFKGGNSGNIKPGFKPTNAVGAGVNAGAANRGAKQAVGSVRPGTALTAGALGGAGAGFGAGRQQQKQQPRKF